jgi:hypothetical protein
MSFTFPRTGTADEAQRRPLPSGRLRIDASCGRPENARLGAVAAWIALAGGFVLLWAGNLDLGPRAARLGMAASEGIGPLGQVLGGWDPAQWPGRVVPSQLWAWGEGGRASSAAVRWPEAIAALTIGLVLSCRLSRVASSRAATLMALTLFSSVGMIHRDIGVGLDLITGMAVVGALDRILGRGTDLPTGAWAALAFLAGGWPPLVLIVLPIVVLARPGRSVSAALAVPIMATVAGWSLWTLRVATPEVLAAALALPLTQKPAWSLAAEVAGVTLPWGPLAVLVAWPTIRHGWNDATRSTVVGWLQVTAVAVLAGTLLPGLAASARVVALAGLAVTAAAVLDRLLGAHTGIAPGATRTAHGVALGVATLWALLIVPLGGYLAAAVPYYRQVSLLLCALGLVPPLLAIWAARSGRTAVAVAAMVVVAVGLKLAHGGVLVPEWNYRLGQGPWGRAIGQWVPPNWPLYVTHAWPDDLMFHTERPVRQLAAPEILAFKPQDRPHYVLLLESEFTHWPAKAPAIERVRSFTDERGGVRVLARTKVGASAPSGSSARPDDPPETGSE